MPNILIRDVSKETLKQIKAMAKQHNRSLQQELKQILESQVYCPDIYQKALAIRKSLKRKKINYTDSTRILRKDRAR
jgi:plasmid stability protein